MKRLALIVAGVVLIGAFPAFARSELHVPQTYGAFAGAPPLIQVVPGHGEYMTVPLGTYDRAKGDIGSDN